MKKLFFIALCFFLIGCNNSKEDIAPEVKEISKKYLVFNHVLKDGLKIDEELQKDGNKYYVVSSEYYKNADEYNKFINELFLDSKSHLITDDENNDFMRNIDNKVCVLKDHLDYIKENLAYADPEVKLYDKEGKNYVLSYKLSTNDDFLYPIFVKESDSNYKLIEKEGNYYIPNDELNKKIKKNFKVSNNAFINTSKDLPFTIIDFLDSDFNLKKAGLYLKYKDEFRDLKSDGEKILNPIFDYINDFDGDYLIAKINDSDLEKIKDKIRILGFGDEELREKYLVIPKYLKGKDIGLNMDGIIYNFEPEELMAVIKTKAKKGENYDIDKLFKKDFLKDF